jgi:thiol-disulfide isomerase/thioredoxin
VSTAAAKKSGIGSTLVVGVLLAFGSGFLVSQGIRQARRVTPVKSGVKAPAFKVEKFGGGTVSLAELKGKVVMLDFWATWCPPCRAEMPSLVKLADEYEKRGVVLLALSRDDEDTAKVDIGNFIDREVPGLGHHLIGLADDPTSDAYKLQVLPTMYFIGRDGEILEAYTSYATEGTLRDRIERALNESP